MSYTGKDSITWTDFVPRRRAMEAVLNIIFIARLMQSPDLIVCNPAVLIGR